MAKKLNQQDLLKLTSIDTPPTDSVAFAAKSDGLYQKIGSTETKLSTTAELLDRVKKAVPSNAVFTDTNTTYTAGTNVQISAANVISATDTKYSLPTASGTTLGGIKVGSRLSISSGSLSANVQSDNNFTTALKNKLDGIAEGATKLSLGTTAVTAYRGDRGNAAYTHISDTTKHITAAERTSWNDKYTKVEVDGLAKYIGSYNSSNGFLVKTDVARNENSMLVLHIKGNSYAGAVPINTLVQVYNYVSSDSIIQTGALNNGYAISEVKVFYYNNLVYFWVPQQSSYTTMTFQLLKAEGQVNRVASVSNSAVPTTGVAKMVTITPRTAWFKNTLTKVSQLSNDSGYITASASITGNAASATKLQTARTIGGVSFNGTANINLPGVNTAGNQNTSGTAAKATTLATTRAINGTNFNGSAAITTALWGTARTLSFTGDVTGSSSVNGSKNVATAMTLANSGVTAGTYRSVTVDAKGRVTAGTKPTTVSGYGLTDAVTTNTTQSITGTKTFTKRIGANLGVKIGTHSTDGLIEWDATNNAFKFNGSLYATGEISALGDGGGGSSGGGGADMLDSWANYTTAKANYYVPASLGMGLYNNKADKSNFQVVTSLPTSPTAGVFYFIKE